MPRVSATFSISLPPKMVRELERVRKREHRTRSELVREALRRYIRDADLGRINTRVRDLAEEQPTEEEIAAIQEGSAQFRSGQFVTLEQLRHELGDRRQQPRAKKSRAAPRR